MNSTMTHLEELHQLYSDFHKDAYGFRPRNDVSAWTEADFNAEFDRLQVVVNENAAREQAEEKVAIKAFEERIARTIECGAKDRAQAMQWIHQAESTDGDDDYLAYTLGLPYRYFKTL